MRLPWSELRLELKTQTNHLFDVWCLKVMALPRLMKRMYQEGLNKALSCLEASFADKASP